MSERSILALSNVECLSTISSSSRHLPSSNIEHKPIESVGKRSESSLQVHKMI